MVEEPAHQDEDVEAALDDEFESLVSFFFGVFFQHFFVFGFEFGVFEDFLGVLVAVDFYIELVNLYDVVLQSCDRYCPHNFIDNAIILRIQSLE